MGSAVSWLRTLFCLKPEGALLDVDCCYLVRDNSDDSVEPVKYRRRRQASARTFRPRSNNHP